MGRTTHWEYAFAGSWCVETGMGMRRWLARMSAAMWVRDFEWFRSVLRLGYSLTAHLGRTQLVPRCIALNDGGLQP